MKTKELNGTEKQIKTYFPTPKISIDSYNNLCYNLHCPACNKIQAWSYFKKDLPKSIKCNCHINP